MNEINLTIQLERIVYIYCIFYLDYFLNFPHKCFVSARSFFLKVIESILLRNGLGKIWHGVQCEREVGPVPGERESSAAELRQLRQAGDQLSTETGLRPVPQEVPQVRAEPRTVVSGQGTHNFQLFLKKKLKKASLVTK